MEWLNLVCLIVGYAILSLGGIAAALWLVFALLDWIIGRTKSLHLIIEFGIDRARKKREKSGVGPPPE